MLLILINIFFSIYSANVESNSIKNVSTTIDGMEMGVCPDSSALNKSIVEDFLTKPYWPSERAETNTGGLTVSQITLLTDSSYSSVCNSFYNKYEEAFDENNGIREKAYTITYYKVDTFYFVVISVRQSDVANYISSGINFIHVYNQNMSLVKAYAF